MLNRLLLTNVNKLKPTYLSEQVRKKWTMEKKHPLDVEYTSGGIFNAKKLPTHK